MQLIPQLEKREEKGKKKMCNTSEKSARRRGKAEEHKLLEWHTRRVRARRRSEDGAVQEVPPVPTIWRICVAADRGGCEPGMSLTLFMFPMIRTSG